MLGHRLHLLHDRHGRVEVTQVEQGLCGASRPGHFVAVFDVITRRKQLDSELHLQALVLGGAVGDALDTGVPELHALRLA